MENKPIKLNLGGVEKQEGGPNSPFLEGFTNVDIRGDLIGVDIVCDISKLTMFEDETVTEIRASHVIEHLDSKKIMETLGEWHRILKPKGLLRIYCPDAEKIARDYIGGRIPCEEFSRLLFGNQEYGENLHRLAISRERLDKIVTNAGFEIVGRDPRHNAYLWDLGIQAIKISKIYPY
jgi:predicted SAM-dependent methyltransferase